LHHWKKTTLIAAAILALVAPLAHAGTTVYGSSAPPTQGVSAPAYYYAINYRLAVQAGDVVTATLTYPAANADLDLTLTSAFYDPVPILPPPGCGALNPAQCEAEIMHYMAQRVGRVTCTDTVGASEHHPDGGIETFTATIEATGTHTLSVINYLNVPGTATPYTLSVTVLRGGVDVTSSTFNPTPPAAGQPGAPGYVINNYLHCAALGLRN